MIPVAALLLSMWMDITPVLPRGSSVTEEQLFMVRADDHRSAPVWVERHGYTLVWWTRDRRFCAFSWHGGFRMCMRDEHAFFLGYTAGTVDHTKGAP